MWCLLLHVAVSTPPSQSLSLQAAHGQCSPRRKPASCGAVTAGSDQGSRRRKAGMHCPVELSANGCVKGRKRSKRAAEPASGSRAAGALQALQGWRRICCMHRCKYLQFQDADGAVHHICWVPVCWSGQLQVQVQQAGGWSLHVLHHVRSCIAVCGRVCAAVLQAGCRAGCRRGAQQARASTLSVP